MKHFLKVADADVLPLNHALALHPELWDQNPIRTTHPGTVHSEASDILLWFNDLALAEAVIDDKDTIPYPAWAALPQARSLIFDIMRRVEGIRLGRVMITRLRPGKRIHPHKDEGAPATYYTRYQVALQSLPGAVFRIEDETVNFRTGEVWMIDNTLKHEVVNNSADDRIVMIVDIRNG